MNYNNDDDEDDEYTYGGGSTHDFSFAGKWGEDEDEDENNENEHDTVRNYFIQFIRLHLYYFVLLLLIQVSSHILFHLNLRLYV